MVTLRTLQFFEKVAETGKMSDAARELFVSQSAISQAIHELEQQYDVILFDRIGKKLYLTDAGRGLLDYAKQIIKENEIMEEFLETASSTRSLGIGATLTVGSSVLWPILDQYQPVHEAVRIRTIINNTGALETLLLQGKLDIALVEGRIENPNLIVRPVIKDRLVLACGNKHRFWGTDLVSLQDLQDEDFVLREPGSGTRKQLIEPLRQNHITYHEVATCSNTAAIVQSVSHNLGITLISERLIASAIANGFVWPCTVCGIDNERTFDLVWHKLKRIDAPLQDFIDLCAKYDRQ